MIRYISNYSNRTHLVASDFNEVKRMSIENRIKYLVSSSPEIMYCMVLPLNDEIRNTLGSQ